MRFSNVFPSWNLWCGTIRSANSWLAPAAAVPTVMVRTARAGSGAGAGFEQADKATAAAHNTSRADHGRPRVATGELRPGGQAGRIRERFDACTAVSLQPVGEI